MGLPRWKQRRRIRFGIPNTLCPYLSLLVCSFGWASASTVPPSLFLPLDSGVNNTTPERVIYFPPNGPFTVPCRPSGPRVKVSLEPESIVQELRRFLIYDPRMGFMVTRAPANLSGSVQCLANLDGEEQTLDFYLHDLGLPPPEIAVAKDNITLSKGQSFVLTCVGVLPLVWDYPQVEGVKPFTVTSTALDKGAYSFLSQLHVTAAQANMTGWHTCRYNHTDPQHFPERTSSSLYVFYSDPQHPFVTNEPFLKVDYELSSNSPLVLDCRTSHPGSEVTLWRVQGHCSQSNGPCYHASTENADQVQLENGVTFDPKRGFVVEYPDNSYNNTFLCKMTHDGAETIKIIVKISSSEDWRPPAPEITGPLIAHATQNSVLTCRVTFLKHNLTAPTLDWITPRGQCFLPNVTVSSNGQFYHLTSFLMLGEMAREESGIYSCRFSEGQEWPKVLSQTDVYVEVRDHLSNFALVSNSKNEEERIKGDHFDLKVAFDGASNESLFLTWEKGGYLVTESDRVTLTNSSSFAVLTVKNLNPSDSGNYTLTARLRGTHTIKTLSSHLQIDYLDKVQVEQTPNFYFVGSDNLLSCQIRGYPNTSLSWNFKPCKDMKGCDYYSEANWLPQRNKMSGNLELLEDQESLSPDQVMLQMDLEARVSGYYRCSGSNQLGASQAYVRFAVTDLDEGMTLNVTQSSPYEGDRVNLTCWVNDFVFNAIEIRRNTSDGRGLIHIKDEPGVLVSYSNTSYSKAMTVMLPPVKRNDTGQYVCYTWYRSGGAEEKDGQNISQALNLQVKPLVPPTVNGNSDSTPKALYLGLGQNTSIDCIAKGEPKPKITWLKNGRPLSIDPGSVKRVFLSNQDQTLVIYNLQREDLATYNCTVSNRAGSVSKTFYIKDDDDMPTSINIEGETIRAPQDNHPNILMIVTIVSVALLLIIMAYFVAKHFHKKRRKLHEQELTSQRLFYKGQLERLSSRLPLVDQADLLPYDFKWEFPKERLRLGRLVGQGAFGRVVEGEAIGIKDGETITHVAVKILKENADQVQRKALLAELKILIFLGKHLNIVNLLGAITRERLAGELMVIVEYCPFGNLKDYLHKNKKTFVDLRDPETGCLDSQMLNHPTPVPLELHHADSHKEGDYPHPLPFPTDYRLYPVFENKSYESEKPAYETKDYKSSKAVDSQEIPDQTILFSPKVVTTYDLLSFAFQCARGMDYLASKKLIHRDLAARNVLVAKDNIVKICDFGLAKESYVYKPKMGKQQAPVPLPVKWMSLESIRERRFSTKSDVWSFGVLMWEIFTLGADPYSGVPLNEDFYKRLKEGYRLEKPDYSPPNLYQIMQGCWKEDPGQRPTFGQLLDSLSSMLEAGVKEHYMTLDQPYYEINAKDTSYMATVGYINQLYEGASQDD